MDGRYGRYSQESSGWTIMKNEEYQEEDVWNMLENNEDINPVISTTTTLESRSYNPRVVHSVARSIPRAGINNIDHHEPRMVQQSAPVNIPEWSMTNKTYNKSSTISSWRDYGYREKKSWDSDEGEDDGDMMPPHEWLARKLARSQTFSFSVCEGVGRTLKGRDLSRVRNSILTRTGFLE